MYNIRCIQHIRYNCECFIYILQSVESFNIIFEFDFSDYDESRHVRPTHLRMKNRSFPAGGYIVVDRLYAKILRQVYPSTYHVIPKTLYQRHDDDTNERHHTISDDNEMNNEVPYRRKKRNHDDKNDKKVINVTYCCANRCRPYDLCEL